MMAAIRPRFRFSLRTALVSVTACCVLVAVVAPNAVKIAERDALHREFTRYPPEHDARWFAGFLIGPAAEKVFEMAGDPSDADLRRVQVAFPEATIYCGEGSRYFNVVEPLNPHADRP